MPLDDLPPGSTVFLDSTILHYAFVDFPTATPQCIRLLDRLRRGELAGCITAPVLNDAIHKVMCSEAAARFGRSRAGLVGWMKQNPTQVAQLNHAGELLHLVRALGPRLLRVDLDLLVQAQAMVGGHGLLASDALIAAVMQRDGITHLATNDDDFDQVPTITVWKPRR